MKVQSPRNERMKTIVHAAARAGPTLLHPSLTQARALLHNYFARPRNLTPVGALSQPLVTYRPSQAAPSPGGEA
eukprot:13860351-Alexandrium_andersonii.AAC.1